MMKPRRAVVPGRAPAPLPKKRKEPEPPSQQQPEVSKRVIRKAVREYARLDDHLREVRNTVKEEKKKLNELRSAIMDALERRKKPACKLPVGTNADNGKPVFVHLRIKKRKAMPKINKDSAIKAMGAWLQSKGLSGSENLGQELYAAVYNNPANVVEKVSLCRIRPRKPRPKKPKAEPPPPKKRKVDNVLMLESDDSDSDSGSDSDSVSDSDSSSDSGSEESGEE